MAGSIYQAFVDVVPSAKGFGSALDKQVSPAGISAGKSASNGINSGILGGFKSLAGPLVAAVASLGIGKAISDSINNASDFQEAGTAITAVFGDADVTIQKFAAGAAQSLGQSTNQL